MEPYGIRLSQTTRARGAFCAGIDPHPAVLSGWGLPNSADGVERCARTMVETLGDLVAVFKPQSAFFEAYGSKGIRALERTLADIRGTGALALLDVKRGDIGSTMAAYGAAYLSDSSPLTADAVTLSPYLGFGSLSAAIELAGQTGRGVYVLALTSNPEGAAVQRATGSDGRSVAQQVVDQAAAVNRGVGLGHVGVVVGATVGRTGVDFSRLNGSILVPGIGAQGGTLADIQTVLGPAAPLALPTVSRELLSAGPDPGRLRAAARPLLEATRRARPREVTSRPPGGRHDTG